MPLTETGIMPASELMEDDWLEVAGTVFRIKQIIKREICTSLTMYDPNNPMTICVLTVELNQPMKVYNQNG